MTLPFTVIVYLHIHHLYNSAMAVVEFCVLFSAPYLPTMDMKHWGSLIWCVRGTISVNQLVH